MLSGSVVHQHTDIRPSGLISVPQDYYDVVEIIESSENKNSRILSFPQQEYPIMSSHWETGFVGFDPIRSLSYRSVISTLSGDRNSQSLINSLYNILYDKPESSVQYLPQLGIEWILIRKDNNDFFSLDKRFNYEKFVSDISDQESVKKVYGGKNLELFRIEGDIQNIYLGNYFLDNNLESIGDVESFAFYNGVDMGKIEKEDEVIFDLNIKNVRVDVGYQDLSVVELENNSVAVSLPNVDVNMSGSIVNVSDFPRDGKKYLGVLFSTQNTAMLSVAVSQYIDDSFVQGKHLKALNPTLSSNGNNYSSPNTSYFIVFDLDQIDFLPNRFHIHINNGIYDQKLDITDENYSINIEKISLFNMNQDTTQEAFTNDISFHVPSDTKKFVLDIPVSERSIFPYLAMDYKTKNASTYLAYSLKENDNYINGDALSLVYDPDIKLTEHGTIWSEDWKTIYYPLRGSEYNNIHINVLTESQDDFSSLEISDMRFSEFAGSKYDILENLFSCSNDDCVVFDNPLSSSDTLSSSSSISPRSFNSSLHSFTIDDINDSSLVVLNAAFSPSWKTYASSCTFSHESISSSLSFIICDLFSKKYYVSEENHIRVNGYGNAWILHSDVFSEDLYDGNKEYNFIIQFSTQKWFYIGAFIAIITLFCIVTVYIYLFVKNLYILLNKRV